MKITDRRKDADKSIKVNDIPIGTYFTGRCFSMGINKENIHLRYYDGILVVNDTACNWDLDTNSDSVIDNYQPIDVELIHESLSK